MPDRLPPKVTQVSPQDMFDALGAAWFEYLHSVPTKEQLCLLIAHWAFETAWGQGMWNYNVGNAKSVEGDGRDYTYFTCTEYASLSAAQQAQARAPWGSYIEIVSVKNGRALLRLRPDHPGCRFRAFKTLTLGAYDYLLLLIKRFSDDDDTKSAWHWVVNPDPVAFCHALHLKGYYTAPEEQYTKQVAALYRVLLQKEFSTENLPKMSSEETEQLQAWSTALIDEGVRDLLAAERETPDGTEEA